MDNLTSVFHLGKHVRGDKEREQWNKVNIYNIYVQTIVTTEDRHDRRETLCLV